ncbi:MAG: hypothetical protein JSS98_09380 [Bacteroidetes bacterium]|nr:hypothetical protein [Bacteroidota bacterium]MBS1736795.1 hypothetical protein [Bacteroidota bacterium]
MTDTPQHVKDIQLKLWLAKPPGERLMQSIRDIETMRKFLREVKTNLGLPLGDLDPVGEYLKKKQICKPS